jgi:glycosyltransferase involved in cell wall biosynthesis
MYRGGAERQVLDLIWEAKRRGYEVSLLVLKQIEDFQEELDELDISVASLGIKKTFFGVLLSPFKFLYLYFFLRKVKPNIIHSHMGWANVFSRILLKPFLNVRLVCTAHNMNEGGWLLNNLYKYTNRLSDFNTNVSRSALDVFLRNKNFSPENSALVYNGFDFHKLQHIVCGHDASEREGIRWLAIGRLTEQKNYPLALESFSKYLKFFPDDELTILGGGDLHEQLLEISKNLKISNNVKFEGVVSNVFDYISKSDAFIMTSNWEGLPISVMEVIATGLPAVLTNVGGISEICEENIAFTLVENNSSNICDAMVRLARNIETNEMTSAVLSNVKVVESRFSMKHIFDEWETIYDIT